MRINEDFFDDEHIDTAGGQTVYGEIRPDTSFLSEMKVRKPVSSAFREWKTSFDAYMDEMLDEMYGKYMRSLNLKVEIDAGYDFTLHPHWLAAYARSLGRISEGIIMVAINYPLLHTQMKKRRIDEDRFNIEAQARITIGHEIAHGLMDFLRGADISTDILEEDPELCRIIDCDEEYEEEIAEEFGESQFPEATGVYGSVLEDVLVRLKHD